jgi:1-deoxy-D-xylulose-5-phosphate synthase
MAGCQRLRHRLHARRRDALADRRAARAGGHRRRGDLGALPFGRGEIRRQGQRVALLAFGPLLYPALQAAEHLNATVVNMRWAKPLDEALLRDVAARHELLVTLEEGAIMGGAGSAVAEALNAAGIARPLLQLGLPDRFIEHGDPARLLAARGLDAPGIEAAVRARLGAGGRPG